MKIFRISVNEIITFYMNPKLAYVTLVYIFGIFDIVITYFRENSNIRM